MEIKIKSSVEKFITKLEEKTIAKVLRTVDLLEQFGNKLGLPHSKKVRTSLFKLCIRGQQEVRIFYIFKKGEIILLHGFIKKSQKTPSKELKQALKKM